MREKLSSVAATLSVCSAISRARQFSLLPATTVPKRSSMRPARRGDQAGADAVLVGERGVAGAVQHLHLVEPGGEAAEHRDLAAHQQQGAAGEDAGAVGVALHWRTSPPLPFTGEVGE